MSDVDIRRHDACDGQDDARIDPHKNSVAKIRSAPVTLTSSRVSPDLGQIDN